MEVVEPAQLVERKADDLLDEISSKQRILGFLPLAMGTAAVGLLAFLMLHQNDEAGAAKWLTLAVGVLGVIGIPWAACRDRQARLVRLHYVFDPMGTKVQERVVRFVETLRQTHTMWAINSAHLHGDWKRNAGAGTSVARRVVRAQWGPPPNIETNARVGVLKVGDAELFFFPDRLLIFGRSGVRAIEYADLEVEAGMVQFSEEAGIPRDAKVVGRTWRFVNKNGGPDRRFSNNYQIPMVLYGTLSLSAPSGLRLNFHTSSDTAPSDAVAELRQLQTTLRSLAKLQGSAVALETLPEFPEPPQPVSLTVLKGVEATRDLLTFRWIDKFPGWASPIAWGVLLSLPAIGLMTWLSTKGIVTGFLLCSSFTLAGGGVGRLVHDFLNQSRAKRLEKASASKSRFRAVLANELRTRPLDVVKFSELVAECGVGRDDADQIADELLLRVMVKFLADGILSDSERGRLKALADALQVDTARQEQLEEKAKTERYRQAVSEALADGTVTAEEARMLNELRARFGIGGSRWVPGDVIPSP